MREADLKRRQDAVPCVDEASSTLAAVSDELGQKAPGLSVIVPTRNEAGNVRTLVERIEAVASRLPVPHQKVEVIFVDDSDDDTPAAVAAIESEVEVSLIHRTLDERVGGLGGAVVAGMRAARAE